jgi:hypothetical protein
MPKAKAQENAITKARKLENTKKGPTVLLFMLSSFRAFVIRFAFAFDLDFIIEELSI